jgi:acyl-CoA hydrolase
VFGGWIMAMVDIAGAVPALRRARSRVVTVAVNSFVFKQPVSVGDVVSFYADVASVGNSSMSVDVCTGSDCLDTVFQLRLPLAWHRPGGLRGVT